MGMLDSRVKRLEGEHHGAKKIGLTLFLPKTNIFVYVKNYTFSKKGCVHKVRCYSVCVDTA